ncbi:uncharacterized protein LOC141706668 [Apium graveolens]|uniref:uncharacterized protein LOC141706668 n=1 Tax=Apium graveolens TaxID=4045 RepID=UPI003D7B8E00
MVNKPWRIIPRPLLETILNNHANHHRVPQPLILHGPRGVGKTTLILERLMERWNEGVHVTGYVDLAESIESNHPKHGHSYPWASWSVCKPPGLSNVTSQLDSCLENMAYKGIELGTISSDQIYRTMSKWHNLNASVKEVLKGDLGGGRREVSGVRLWENAVRRLSVRGNVEERGGVLGVGEKSRSLRVEEGEYYREAVAALRLAKEVIKVQQKWRGNAVRELNEKGGFSRSLANSATDWPCLLLELLSAASEFDYFQPKLVINNIDVLKNAELVDNTMVRGSLYHDSLIWRIIALGANERILPVILLTSDSYYSYRAFMDFGFPDIFISRETFGWTPQEGKLHMVNDYFSPAEWNVIVEVLGPNPRHLFELYALKQSNYYQKIMEDRSSTFEDIVDAYLAYLQITVVNPAMDKALSLLQKFAVDARSGKVSKDKLRFGAPWRHPPPASNTESLTQWAKLQLLDFVQSLVSTEFGINYLADCSLEILDDPSALALVEVGLLYAQRDPSFIRPISRGIQRCLVRWLVQERLQMSFRGSLRYMWQRSIRGRSYRHLMLQVGYK